MLRTYHVAYVVTLFTLLACRASNSSPTSQETESTEDILKQLIEKLQKINDEPDQSGNDVRVENEIDEHRAVDKVELEGRNEDKGQKDDNLRAILNALMSRVQDDSHRSAAKGEHSKPKKGMTRSDSAYLAGISRQTVDACSSGQIAALTSATGVIQSPGYPKSLYPNNLRCQWRITAPDGQVIRLTFSLLQVEGGAGCRTDSLSIYNGDSAQSPLLDKYCGSQLPPPLTSTSNAMFLVFVSDVVQGDVGFQLSWSFVSPSPVSGVQTGDPCSQVVELRDLSGMVRLPAATGNYPDAANCRWRILVPNDKLRIRITFLKLDIEGSNNCEYDKLSIYDGGDDKSKLIDVYCGSLLPQELVQSSGPVVYIGFTSDEETSASGFILSWNTSDSTLVQQPSPSDASCGISTTSLSVSVGRIVGGETATKNSWPWQCSIQLYRRGAWTQWCGASVLSKSYVISAAHCLYDIERQRIPDPYFKVVCGDHDQKVVNDPARQTANLTQAIIHQSYNVGFNDYDIVILKLSNDLKLDGSTVRTICLPQDTVASGTKCVTTGWGDTEDTGDETVLRQVVVPIISQSRCSQRLFYGNAITNNMICAGYAEGGKDACLGDSGGPLVCFVNGRWRLQGVTSFGLGCADPNKPGIYVRVTRFIQWIQDKTGVTP